jgi:hypothetical protein
MQSRDGRDRKGAGNDQVAESDEPHHEPPLLDLLAY